MQIEKNLIDKIITELNIKIIKNLINNEKFDIDNFLKEVIKNNIDNNIDKTFEALICKNVKDIKDKEVKEAVIKLRKKYYEVLDEYYYLII